MATSTIKYFKNSNTGQLICEQVITSDIITNIPKNYYDIYNHHLGETFDLNGFLQIKGKKWNLYRTRWKTTKINYEYYDNLNLKVNNQKIRKEKLKKLNNLKIK